MITALVKNNKLKTVIRQHYSPEPRYVNVVQNETFLHIFLYICIALHFELSPCLGGNLTVTIPIAMVPVCHWNIMLNWFVLRTVPTIVIAHTFCASPDTRISYRRCLLMQGYFCAL